MHACRNQCGSTGWQSQHSNTSWANNETWYPSLQRSKTSLSLTVSGLKVFEPNELFFNYSCKRHTSSLGSSVLIIFINPPISNIQQWRKLLQFQLILRPPQPHYLSFSKSLLLPRFAFILSTTPETQYTCTSTQSHTYLYIGKGTHRYEHTHTQLLLWFVMGVISLTQGTVIMYFVCSSQGDEIRGQHTTANPDTTHPTRGGIGRGVSVKVTVSEDIYLLTFWVSPLQNLFYKLWPW